MRYTSDPHIERRVMFGAPKAPKPGTLSNEKVKHRKRNAKLPPKKPKEHGKQIAVRTGGKHGRQDKI